MKTPFNENDVVAERRFESPGGPVDLRFHRPLPWPSESAEREPDWVCWYSIQFPSGEVKRRGTPGIDSVQALLLALASAMGDLRYVGDGTPTRRPVLRWLGSDDLGLTINHFD